jgi:hypothetical protein
LSISGLIAPSQLGPTTLFSSYSTSPLLSALSLYYAADFLFFAMVTRDGKISGVGGITYQGRKAPVSGWEIILESEVLSMEETVNQDKNSLEVKHEVRIHIDRKSYQSPNPTIGAALYLLGHVTSGKELFREVQGNHEDVLIPCGETELHLKMDEHFYSEREFEIIANGRQKVVTNNELSFAEIVALAFDTPPSGPDVIFTITYRKGPHKNPEGTLIEGGTVKIKNGMIFNVTPTRRS